MDSRSILSVPQEITELALVFSDPSDVASFAQTCRTARRIVYGNGTEKDQHLWRRIYLHQPFDDPRRLLKYADEHAVGNPTIDWMKLLQRRWKAMLVVENKHKHPLELSDALYELTLLVRNALPFPSAQPQSLDLLWANDLLNRNGVYDATGLPWSPGEQQYAMQLWSLLGWRNDALYHSSTAIQSVRNTSRAFVYDLRNYRQVSNWGPFLPSTDRRGLVDWRHVQAMIVVIQNNLLDLSELWVDTRPPASLDAIRAFSAPGSHQRDPRDWAGVEGTWRRFVCFMDYR